VIECDKSSNTFHIIINLTQNSGASNSEEPISKSLGENKEDSFSSEFQQFERKNCDEEFTDSNFLHMMVIFDANMIGVNNQKRIHSVKKL
jgi:hypothetical protein